MADRLVLRPGPQRSERELAALAEPTMPVGRRFTTTFLVASFGQWLAILLPVQLLLPRQLALIDETNKITNFALVASLGTLFVLVMGPLWGAVSDRTTSRFGRRHPWRVFGAVWSAGGFVALGYATSLTSILIITFLHALGGAALGASFNAAVPDRVPPQQRGRISAYVELAQRAALISGVAAGSVLSIRAGYTMIAGVLVVSTLVFVLATPDSPLPRDRVPSWQWRRFLRGFWVSPRRHPDFAWGMLTRFGFVLGTAFATGFLFFLLQDAVGYEGIFPGHGVGGGVTILIMVFTAGLVSTTYLAGALSDRFGQRKVVLVIGAVVFSLGCLLVMLSQTWSAVLAACVLMGAGTGCYAAVDGPIAAGLLPAPEDRARHLGIAGLAVALPQVLAPALGGPIIAYLGGYPTLYAFAAGSTILAGLAVLRIKTLR